MSERDLNFKTYEEKVAFFQQEFATSKALEDAQALEAFNALKNKTLAQDEVNEYDNMAIADLNDDLSLTEWDGWRGEGPKPAVLASVQPQPSSTLGAFNPSHKSKNGWTYTHATYIGSDVPVEYKGIMGFRGNIGDYGTIELGQQFAQLTALPSGGLYPSESKFDLPPIDQPLERQPTPQAVLIEFGSVRVKKGHVTYKAVFQDMGLEDGVYSGIVAYPSLVVNYPPQLGDTWGIVSGLQNGIVYSLGAKFAQAPSYVIPGNGGGEDNINPPIITTFGPTNVAQGARIHVYGSNLSEVTHGQFYDTEGSAYGDQAVVEYEADNIIRVVVPPAVGGGAKLRLFNSTGFAETGYVFSLRFEDSSSVNSYVYDELNFSLVVRMSFTENGIYVLETAEEVSPDIFAPLTEISVFSPVQYADYGIDIESGISAIMAESYDGLRQYFRLRNTTNGRISPTILLELNYRLPTAPQLHEANLNPETGSIFFSGAYEVEDASLSLEYGPSGLNTFTSFNSVTINNGAFELDEYGFADSFFYDQTPGTTESYDFRLYDSLRELGSNYVTVTYTQPAAPEEEV